MIALGSKSYPYLAVAQHYGIEYGEVLKYVDTLNKYTKPPFADWKTSAWFAYKDEMQRREVSGV